MSYTTQRANDSFPHCLVIHAGDTIPPYEMQHFRHAHNRALQEFLDGRGRKAERAILALASGIDAWISGNLDGASDGYGAPNVTVPLLQAFHDALNFDLGRLDGGALSAWCDAQYTRCGLNPDTGEFLRD